MSFLGGHWYPSFGFLVNVSSGVQSQSGFCLIHFCGGKCNVHLPTSWQPARRPVLSPHTVVEVRLTGFKLVLSEYM